MPCPRLMPTQFSPYPHHTPKAFLSDIEYVVNLHRAIPSLSDKFHGPQSDILQSTLLLCERFPNIGSITPSSLTLVPQRRGSLCRV